VWGLRRLTQTPLQQRRAVATTLRAVDTQHLEGGPWTFLAIARYNSWDDFAAGEKNSVAQTTKKDSPWFRLRDHTDYHTDTLTDRIEP
jgi:hypothetical protein